MAFGVSRGTKSVLFGAHAFWLHGWFVAWAWWKLYGFPWDPRLWVAFFIHDIGYIGKRKMDDEEGETHPELGAAIMGWLFGEEWLRFTLYHSRFYAKRFGAPFSRLCVADKLSCALIPAWLYIPMVRATGELDEYMGSTAGGDTKYKDINGYERPLLQSQDPYVWCYGFQEYVLRWVEENR